MLRFLSATLLALAAAQDGLVKEKAIALEGGTSFDLVNLDPANHRLYVGHSPKVDVIDTLKGEKVGEVVGVDGAHGAVAVPDVKRGFATAGQKNKLIVFELDTFKVVKEIETGANPDVVLHVASAKEVWSFNGRGKDVTCVDAATLEVKSTIALGGKPELAVEDADKGVVYVNLEDKSAICEIDVKKHEVKGTHPLAPGEGPTGLAFDAKRGLLFSGCANKLLVAVDIASWKVVGQGEIGQKCDGAVYDAGTSCVWASCNDKSGGLRVKDAKTFESLPALETPGGKTCALDPATHKLYVVSGPKRGEKGTVQVTVYAPR